MARPGPARGALLPAAGWAALGLAAVVTIALGGHATGSGHPPATRWFWGSSPLDDRSLGSGPAVALLRCALVALVAAWLGLGVLVRRRRLGLRGVVVIAVLWSLPLLVVAPLFSDDAHLYVAYGDLVRHGFDPYTTAPSALGQVPDLRGVNGYWLNTASPYGGLFLDLMGLIVGATGEHPLAALLVLRGVNVLALAALAALMVLVAAELGRRAAPVLWVGLLNPLMLLNTVSGLHNDVLMLVFVVGGVLLAVRGRPLLAIVVCAVGADVKVVALLALAVLVTDYAWHAARWPARMLRLVGGAAVGGAAFALAGIVTLQGFGWVRDLDVPGRAFTLFTPVDSFTALVGAFPLDQVRTVALGLTAVLAVTASVASRWTGPVRGAGLALTAGVLLGVVLWPWYWLWPVSLFAIAGTARDRAVMAAGSVFLLFVTLPSGSPDYGAPGHRLLTPPRAEALVLLLALGALVALAGQWRGRLDAPAGRAIAAARG